MSNDDLKQTDGLEIMTMDVCKVSNVFQNQPMAITHSYHVCLEASTEYIFHDSEYGFSASEMSAYNQSS